MGTGADRQMFSQLFSSPPSFSLVFLLYKLTETQTTTTTTTIFLFVYKENVFYLFLKFKQPKANNEQN